MSVCARVCICFMHVMCVHIHASVVCMHVGMLECVCHYMQMLLVLKLVTLGWSNIRHDKNTLWSLKMFSCFRHMSQNHFNKKVHASHIFINI